MLHTTSLDDADLTRNSNHMFTSHIHYVDNTSAINISKNPTMHSNTRYIPIKYHFLCEQVLEQKVILEYVPSKEQVADKFTKSLPREAFEYLRKKMGIVSATQKIRSA